MKPSISEGLVAVPLAGGSVLLVPPALEPKPRRPRARRQEHVRCDCAVCRQQDALPERLQGIPGAWQLAMPYPAFDHAWFWRSMLPERKGQPCAVLARGRMNSILVQFADGTRVITSRYAVRKLKLPIQSDLNPDRSRAAVRDVPGTRADEAPGEAGEAEAPALPLQI